MSLIAPWVCKSTIINIIRNHQLRENWSSRVRDSIMKLVVHLRKNVRFQIPEQKVDKTTRKVTIENII